MTGYVSTAFPAFPASILLPGPHRGRARTCLANSLSLHVPSRFASLLVSTAIRSSSAPLLAFPLMAPATPKSPTASPEPHGQRKRRRTALACEECRERKRKCDGIKPVCGACARRSAGCVWNGDRSYVEGLKARIRSLEEQVSRDTSRAYTGTASPFPHPRSIPLAESAPHILPSHAPDIQTTRNPDAQTTNGVDVRATNGLDVQTTNHTPPSFQLDPSVPQLPETTFESVSSDSVETSVDGMGVVGSLHAVAGPRARRQSDYFGPSSTVSLLTRARNVLGRRCCGRGPPGSESCPACRHVSSNSQPPSVPNGNAMFGFTVPPRAEADSLLESYWTWVHSLYPFLHRLAFIERYTSIWNPRNDSVVYDANTPQPRATVYYDGLNDQSFYCLLNVVFAMGALFNSRIDQQDRGSVSYSFFERAKKLLDLDMLAQGCTPLVQTLLLMGQYLQSTDMSSSCWNIVGMAIRMAQCIGLHHDPIGCKQGCCPKRKYHQIDIEMRRRTWAGCVLLDR